MNTKNRIPSIFPGNSKWSLRDSWKHGFRPFAFMVATVIFLNALGNLQAGVITVHTSDASKWKRSTFSYFDNTDPNWPGVTQPLPSAATYTLNTTNMALPAGFNGIFSGSGVTFYRSVVSLPAFSEMTADLSARADNNMEIFVNGISLARYGTDTCGFCGTFRLFVGADGSVINGALGGRPFSNVQSPFPKGIWVSGGDNEIVVAVRNLSGGDQGGFLVNLVLTTTPPPTPAILLNNAVSWWKAENNANDSAGASPGTMVNGATFSAGKVGQAFAFDGINDYARVPAPFRSFNNQITVEYWMNVTNFQGGAGLGQGTEGVDNMSSNVWLMHLNGAANGANTLTWFVNDSGMWKSVSTPGSVTGGWRHVAGVADSSSTKIYLDGVLVGTGPGIASGIRSNASSVINLGNDVRYPASRLFQGALDEVTIYNRALSAAEIQAIFNASYAGKVPPTAVTLPANSVGWWKAAGNGDNSVGLGSASLQNGAAYTAGKVGQAFNFDGVNDLARVSFPYRSFTTQITVEYWIKMVSGSLGSGLGQATAGVDSMASNVWLMHYNGDGTLSWFVNDSGTWRSVATPSSSPILGEWHHIAGVADGASTRLYLDGVLVGSAGGITNGIQANSSSVINMGVDVRFPTTRLFQGALDEVTIYSRALTASEIQSIYVAGASGKVALPTPDQYIVLDSFVSWPNPAPINDRTPLTCFQLNATANVAGTFYYYGLEGTTLTAGSNILGVSFSPNNPTDPNQLSGRYSPASASTLLVVHHATNSATITLGNLTQTYDGQAHSVTATTSPANLPYQVTYNGSCSPPVNAGVYTVVGTITDAGYYGSTTNTLTIGKGPATVTLSDLSHAYNGEAKSASATTSPAGMLVNITYNGSNSAPTNGGSYTVIATANNANYSGSATGTLTIAKAPATVTLSNLSQAYNGQARSVSATTSPTNLAVSFTYGSGSGPINAGSYTVVATIDNQNYAGSTTNTLTITKAAATVTLGSLSQEYNGQSRPITVATSPAGLLFNLTYNGSSFAPTNAGSYTVIGTINESNYSGSATNTLVIFTNKIIPVITWANPASIPYGTELGGTQLSATANVPGTFFYTPSSGTVLDPGTQVLTVNFTPTDPTNYHNTSKQVALTVVDVPAGVVVSWGDNSRGQTNAIPGLSGVTAVAGGQFHTLALQTNGTVVAWGYNGYGQLNVPAGLAGVKAIAAGAYHSVALRTNGTVVAWGDETTTGFPIVPNLTNVAAGLSAIKAISAGHDHVLALKTNGTVVAWGANGNGQTNVPSGLSNVIAIAAGHGHNVALKTNGTVVTWGFSNAGLMNVPTGLSGLTAITAGQYHYAGLKADGTVVSWGLNTFGQTNVPAGLSNVIAIAAGGNITLALKNNGTVVSWGSNTYGQTNVPAGLSNVSAIAAGPYHALAVVNTRPPLLSAITPLEALGGAADPVTLNLSGAGFTAGSTVCWDTREKTTLATTFVNSSNLTAQIPASLLANPLNVLETAQVSVVDPIGGVSSAKAFTIKPSDIGPVQSKVAGPGLTSTVQTLPTAPGQAGLSASFVNNSGTPATVTAAAYTSNPIAGTSIDTGGGIVDLQITGADASDTATVQFYYGSAVTGPAETNLVLRYYNGTVWTNLLSSGGATPVKNMTNNLDGTVSGGKFTVAFSGSSRPRITELTGTVIAMSLNRAPIAFSQNVTINPGADCSAAAIIDKGSYEPDEGDTLTITQTPPGPYSAGVHQVILTVTDDHGASSSSAATVTIIDDIPPTLTVPSAIVISNDPGNCGAIVHFTVTAADHCSDVSALSEPASGSFFPKGVTTVTTVAGDAFGNTTTRTFTVTVNDTEAPTLIVPTPIVVSNDPGRCGAVVNFIVAAADNCSDVRVVSTPASGSVFPKGLTTVNTVATDSSGNMTTKAFTVSVNDTEAPAIANPAANQIVESDGAGNTAALNAWLASYGGAVATDNCGDVSWNHDFSALSNGCGATGSAAVTFVARDASGNSSSTTATFRIVDTTGPVLTSNARDILPKEKPIVFTVNGEDINGETTLSLAARCYAINGAGREIDKSGSCIVEITGQQVKILESGGVGTIIEITATGTDDCGNQTTAKFVVKVLRPPNEGVGNGADGNTPGSANNGGNDTPPASPGNPGARKKN